MLFIKLLRRVTSNMAVESGLDFLGGLCAKPRKFVYISIPAKDRMNKRLNT